MSNLHRGASMLAIRLVANVAGGELVAHRLKNSASLGTASGSGSVTSCNRARMRAMLSTFQLA